MSAHTIVITGASSGIGEALALRLASRGASLVLVGRNEESILSVSERCAASGITVKNIIGDITVPATVSAVKGACQQLPPLSGLVNNAGFGAFGESYSFSRQTFLSLLDTNLLAPFELSRALLPLLLRNADSGNVATIVNIGSDAGLKGFEQAAAYCASKGGLHLMGSALRAEWRSLGIRVTTVAPGRVDTCFNNKKPGMRPGALSAEATAEVIEFCLYCDPVLELSEIHLDSMIRG